MAASQGLSAQGGGKIKSMAWMIYNKSVEKTIELELSLLRKFYRENRCLVLDTETVGSGHLIEVVELAIYSLNEEEGVELKLDLKISPFYNREKYSDKNPFWPEVSPLLEKTLENKVIIAYNASFDRRAIEIERHRWRTNGASGGKETNWYDAGGFLRRYLGLKHTPKLENVAKIFREDLNGEFHTAKFDAYCLAFILSEIARKHQLPNR